MAPGVAHSVHSAASNIDSLVTRNTQILNHKELERSYDGNKVMRVDTDTISQEKPNLVIHVGPPKTASTTIQQTMTEWNTAGVLALDSYIYAGSYFKDRKYRKGNPLLDNMNKMLKDRSCHRAMSNARMSSAINNSTTSLHDILSSVPCANDIVQAFQPFADNQTNILISDETLSFHVNRWFNLPQPSGMDWLSLKELLGSTWNITVVVAYRRYADWLPSAKQQIERWKPSKAELNAWPGDEGPGKMIENLFPRYWRETSPGDVGLPYYYTDSIVSSIQQAANQGDSDKQIHAVVLNLHELSAENNFTAPFVISTFVCQTLPQAANLCAYSRQLDQAKSESRTNPSQKRKIMYDQLVNEAAISGYIDVSIHKYGRHSAGTEAFKYHRKLLEEASEEMETNHFHDSYDFPLVCPTEVELSLYLDNSLRYESKIMPEFFATFAGMKRHQSDFWKGVSEKKYCHLNTKAILQQRHWQNFFENLPLSFYDRKMSK